MCERVCVLCCVCVCLFVRLFVSGRAVCCLEAAVNMQLVKTDAIRFSIARHDSKEAEQQTKARLLVEALCKVIAMEARQWQHALGPKTGRRGAGTAE